MRRRWRKACVEQEHQQWTISSNGLSCRASSLWCSLPTQEPRIVPILILDEGGPMIRNWAQCHLVCTSIACYLSQIQQRTAISIHELCSVTNQQSPWVSCATSDSCSSRGQGSLAPLSCKPTRDNSVLLVNVLSGAPLYIKKLGEDFPFHQDSLCHVKIKLPNLQVSQRDFPELTTQKCNFNYCPLTLDI